MNKTLFYQRNKTIANNFKYYQKIEPVGNVHTYNMSTISFAINNFDILENMMLVLKYDNIFSEISIDEYIISNYEYIKYIDIEKDRIMKDIHEFEYMDYYDSIFHKINLVWTNHNNWSDLDLYKFDITKQYIELWNIFKNITNGDNYNVLQKKSILKEYESSEYRTIVQKKGKPQEVRCNYKIYLYINDNLVSDYTYEEYKKIISLDASPKKIFLEGINQEKNTLYNEILFFHKTNFQKFDEEKMELVVEFSEKYITDCTLLSKNVYISNIEKIILNSNNRIIPDIESISVLANEYNVIDIPFNGMCIMLIINVSNHTIEMIDELELFLYENKDDNNINLLNIHESKCMYTKTHYIYKFSIHPFSLNYANSDACDFAKISKKYINLKLKGIPEIQSYVHITSYNYKIIP